MNGTLIKKLKINELNYTVDDINYFSSERLVNPHLVLDRHAKRFSWVKSIVSLETILAHCESVL